MNFETTAALSFIDAHAQRAQIIAMYQTGPPTDKGFMWCSAADFPAPQGEDSPQGEAFNIMKDFVLREGYDSSAYALMHRAIQKALKDRTALAAAVAALPCRPPSPPRQLAGFEIDWGSVRDARGELLPSGMDAANAKATKILFEEGGKAAVHHMFTRPDGSTRSYGEMRSMYG